MPGKRVDARAMPASQAPSGCRGPHYRPFRSSLPEANEGLSGDIKRRMAWPSHRCRAHGRPAAATPRDAGEVEDGQQCCID